ncbi:hypothetical protein PVAND_016664 [Polypedilum vanderplanki]|uniref:Uncharacterized protein n=1 Tax=Polypedilum vanderplanki TaxID=319348 RepID=A0A9J6BFS0_POLVA|nr:hypothetical protein PVAND_016664 [Polypedilum vanderplanki]
MNLGEKILEVVFGANEEEVIMRTKKTAVESFVSGRLKEARESFNSAYKKSDIDTDTERDSKELMEITTIMIEAEEDRKKEKYSEYIYKMQKIYSECKNDDMKAFIGENRNKQAQKFEEIAENLKDEGKLEDAKKFFQFAYKICTPENPKKKELQDKLNGNDKNWELL